MAKIIKGKIIFFMKYGPVFMGERRVQDNVLFLNVNSLSKFLGNRAKNKVTCFLARV